jgi:sugar O-acyltransferase (sialic acid O-acetyltransferase NeuD family)
MFNRVVIVGAFQETIDLVIDCGFEIIGLIDRNSIQKDFPYSVLCDDDAIMMSMDKLLGASIVLTPDAPDTRMKLYNIYSELGFQFATLISPGAKVATSSVLSEGVSTCWNSHISAQCRIGKCVRINTGANVMHDSTIGDFTTIAPNAVILGRVTIEKNCYIGANSTVLPGLIVGEYSIVGAGAVVTKNVPPRSVVIGNPARVIRMVERV